MNTSPKDFILNPDTKKPSKCDLCGDFLDKTIENRIVTARAMRLAVEKGFHVATEGIKATVIYYNPDGPDRPIDRFKQLVETFPNAWGVCPSCWEKLKKYMKNPDYGTDVKPFPVFKAE